MCIAQEDKDIIQTLLNAAQNQLEAKNEYHARYYRLVVQMNTKYAGLQETLWIKVEELKIYLKTPEEIVSKRTHDPSPFSQTKVKEVVGRIME
ncbi:hypothetical protein R1flu_014490 [Riccia fluitans]|uniref:Uncharacterized protein n=1 Tax=Riccia fluitans TaxID=41844 RepID=A0ABD1YHC4_9MARC